MIKFNTVRTKEKVSYYINNFNFFTRKRKDYRGYAPAINNITKKLSMPDNIWRNNDTLFYVPNFPHDLIQNHIVNKETYYEAELLKELNNIIPEHAHVLDIGANIGNHSLYWAKEHGAQKIIAFEAVKSTYDILQKNIEINKLENIIEAHNVAVSDQNGKAKIHYFTMSNIGATSIQNSEEGNIPTIKLDDFQLPLQKIDFIKIDVEGHEIKVLTGAIQTITKFKPKIFIEVFENNKNLVFQKFSELKYNLAQKFPNDNYLFIPQE